MTVSKKKRFKYLLLDSELKKQTSIVKNQYKFCKVLIKVINKNGEYGVKTEDDVHHK